MITAIDKYTALVIIDLQKGILQRETIHPMKDIIEKSAMLVEAFHQTGLPVVAVNVVPTGTSWLKTRKENNVMRSGVNTPPDYAEIIPELKTSPADIFITKNTWSAFYNTSLHEELQRRNITGIVLCGVATSIGVEGTARAAGERGYNISFATDAMTDMNMDAHLHSLRYIYPRLGEQGTTAEIIEKLKERI